MRLSLLLIPLAGAGCVASKPSIQAVAERLKQFPDWPLCQSMSDAHGVVALRIGQRLAVRFDDDSPPTNGPASMAIYTGQSYKGEFLVIEEFRGFALGWITIERAAANHLIGVRPEDAIQVGDRAACKPS